MIDVRRLRVFSEVAGHGSFSAAADSLRLTQSAVSQHVAALEREVGLPLLERGTRPVALTAAGEALMRHATGIFARLDGAEQELGELAGRVPAPASPAPSRSWASSPAGAGRGCASAASRPRSQPLPRAPLPASGA